MKVVVQSIHFDADKKLVDFIESKVEKLGQFYEGIISSEVFLRLDKANDSANKIVEIKLLIKGKDLFAKKKSKSFEESTDSAVSALEKQLKKHKEKLIKSHT